MHISKVKNNLSFLGFSLFLKKPKKEDFQSYSEVYNPDSKGLNVNVPADGYKSFYCPRISGKSKGQKVVTIKEGKATENGSPYTGFVIFKDKNDELIGLKYKNGDLIASYKGNSLYKKYERLPKDVALNDDGFAFSYKFQDDSCIEEETFFEMDDVDYERITLAKSGSITCIKRNNNPKYRGEPFFRVTRNNISTALLLDSADERFEFKTLKEAEDYFLSAYGIKAEFVNLKQAHLLKYAVDKFAQLNYQGKGNKIFEGLEIVAGKTDQFISGKLEVEFNWNENESYSEDELEVLDESKFQNYKATIIFNKDFKWENLELSQRKDYSINFHSENGADHGICHELAHFLHLKESPKQFYISAITKPLRKDVKLVAMVSNYAKKNYGEFIAEYITGRLAGKVYPKVVDALYEKYGGPDLFTN